MAQTHKFPGNAYRVFQDEQRHTCIRVSADKQGVYFIPFNASLLEVNFLTNREFEQTYTRELTDYPVKKAATSYLGATWLSVEAVARRHLEHLSSGKHKDTAVQYNFEEKESIMTAEATEAAEKKAAGKTKKAAPEAKAAPKKGAAKPAPKAAPKKVAAPEKEKKVVGGGAKRTSKEAGMKIKVLEKNPAVREGSAREAQFKAILSSKTSDEAAEKLRAIGVDKPWDVVRVAVNQGIIELV